MEKYYALIKNGLVTHVIIATEDFLPLIQEQHDHIVEVPHDNHPNPGDSYYPDTKLFIPNDIEFSDMKVDMSAPHLNQGTESSFEPVALSKYKMSYENGVVVIGCKKYSAPGLLDAAHKVLVHQEKNPHVFSVTKDKAFHGKFDISMQDVQTIYDTLRKVKF